jgi:hypothetical protein
MPENPYGMVPLFQTHPKPRERDIYMNKIRISMVAMVVMVSLHTALWAQTPPERTSTLSGFVRDSSDGELLPNAAVAIAVENRTMGALSNAEGYYAIPDIPAGTWVVTSSYIGYTTRQDTLALTGQGLRWDIELERQAIPSASRSGLRNSTRNLTFVLVFGVFLSTRQ